MHHDPWVLMRERPHERRILHGRGAQNDSRRPELEIGLEALTRPNPATHFEPRPEHRSDRSNGLALHGPAFASALEIDHVQEWDFALPGKRACRGVCIVNGDRVVAPLVET